MSSYRGIELPPGWEWSTLGELCEKPCYGWTTKATKDTAKYRLLRTTDISKGRVDWNSVPWCLEEPQDESDYLLKPGDIVISRAGSIGLSALIEECPPRTLFASYLIRFCPKEGVAGKYLAYFLKSSLYWNQIRETAAGIAIPNINAKKLENIELPIAPSSEQLRIVKAVEALLSQVDAGSKYLARTRMGTQKYRAAVLKAACEGRLVPTEAELARAEGRGYETAELLLEKLQASRRKRIASAVPILGLPEGWTTATIGQLAEVGTGATPLRSNPTYYEGGDIPWVTSSALNQSVVRTASEFVTAKALKETNLTIYPSGTLLVAMYGEGKTRGKCSELQGEACTNQAIAALVLEGFAEACRPYLKLFLWKNYEDLRRLSSGGVQPNLNLSLIKNLRLPLPPLAEQERIVGEAERILSLVQQLEATVSASLRRAESLRLSVLRGAFEGRLVPQDPNDEPASVLLERIRQTRASQTAEPRARKVRTKPVPAPPPSPPPPARAEKAAPVSEPEPQEADFLELPRDEQVDIAWETLFGQGMLDKDVAIRTVADELRSLDLARFKRLRQDGPLYRAIAAAIERGVRVGSFDRPRRGCVRAVLPDPKEYEIEDWQQCLLAVTGPEPADIDATLRAAAEWARDTLGLEYARLREDGVILTGLREALEEAVRTGELVRRGGRVRQG